MGQERGQTRRKLVNIYMYVVDIVSHVILVSQGYDIVVAWCIPLVRLAISVSMQSMGNVFKHLEASGRPMDWKKKTIGYLGIDRPRF